MAVADGAGAEVGTSIKGSKELGSLLGVPNMIYSLNSLKGD